MSYYITDLPPYTGLAKCAKSAISYAVLYVSVQCHPCGFGDVPTMPCSGANILAKQTSYLCPPGPQALASCACIKEGMTKEILSSISSNVRNNCDSTATDDISSAVGVSIRGT